MVRPKEWLLTIPRTAVEGGEDIFYEGDTTPLATRPPYYNSDATPARPEKLNKVDLLNAMDPKSVHE